MSLTSGVQDIKQDATNEMPLEQLVPIGQLVFTVGIGTLLFVPVFKEVTRLPPYLGMVLGLGFLWVLTDVIHDSDSESQKLKVPQALSQIDTQYTLFFLGILLLVGRTWTQHM
jgi:Na+/H+ antiporter NhaD/arsenite permease-like protein